MRSIETMPGARRSETARRFLRGARGRLAVLSGRRWDRAEDLDAGIKIAELVCPLRYDVLVRLDFFERYAKDRQQYEDDPAGFVASVRGWPYYRWWHDSELVRSGLARRTSPAELELAFDDRIHRSVAMYRAAEDGRFDSQPIVLKTADTLLPPTTDRTGPPTGKSVSGRYFLGDGCHRLALRMLRGETILRRPHFQVWRYRRFSPFDSTSILARRLELAPERYFAFLSMRYAPPTVVMDGRALVAHVSSSEPRLLPELESIIRTDGYATEAGLEPGAANPST